MKINSNRLYLRRLTVDDASQQYVDWLNDPDVSRFIEVRHSFQTISSCQDFIENANGDENSYLFGIFERVNNNHIRRIHEKKYISDGVRCGAFAMGMLREEFNIHNSQNSAWE